MELLVWVAVFVLGTSVGSFLNAALYRFAVSDGFVPRPSLGAPRLGLGGRSVCPHCGHTLAWYDLIPLVSYALLRGRCRYCTEKISVQYPLVELACGLLFAALAAWTLSPRPSLAAAAKLGLGGGVELAYLWTVGALLIGIFVYDLKHYVILDKLLYPAILVSGSWYLVSSIWFDAYTIYEIRNTVYAALGAAAFFFLLHALSKGRAMGFGDVKLAFFMGLFLGWPNVFVALFTSFLLGGIAGIALIAIGRKQWGSRVPFGPFLAAGTFVALLWGEQLIAWYLGLLVY